MIPGSRCNALDRAARALGSVSLGRAYLHALGLRARLAWRMGPCRAGVRLRRLHHDRLRTGGHGSIGSCPVAAMGGVDVSVRFLTHEFRSASRRLTHRFSTAVTIVTAHGAHTKSRKLLITKIFLSSPSWAPLRACALAFPSLPSLSNISPETGLFRSGARPIRVKPASTQIRYRRLVQFTPRATSMTGKAAERHDACRRYFAFGLERRFGAPSSIQVGAWSLAFSQPRTCLSTPAALSRGAITGLSNK